MKFTKIFLFTLLAIFSLSFITNVAQASTGSGSVTVTVTSSPNCTVLTDTNYNNSPCSGICTNGATNYPTCTLSATGALSIIPSSCTILSGASTCTTTGATWTTANTTSPALVDANMNTTLSTLANKATALKVWVAYPQTVFNLKDGANILDTKTATAFCTTGTSWDGLKCAPAVSCIVLTDTNYNTSPCSGICANGATNYPICTLQSTFTITSSAGSGGTITPSGVKTYIQNWSQFYAVSANSGYKTTGIIVDGVSEPLVGGYAFYNIVANHTISATFSPSTAVCTIPTDTNYNTAPCAGTCKNGANNYPTCTTNITVGPNGNCLNGATNPTLCTIDINNKCLNGYTNPPTCTTPPTCPNGAINPPACTTFNNCPAPTTKIITGITCDVNANGDAAISGSVTRQQTKTAPSCTFGTPVDNTNSTYVSDTCKYPTQVCANGAVNYSLCTVDNNGSCLNGATNPTACTNNPIIGSNGKCLNGAVNPILCTIDNNNKCLNGNINPPVCTTLVPLPPPSITSFNIMSNGKSALSPNTIKYNTRVNIDWTSADAVSCACTSADKKGVVGSTCGDTVNNNPGSFQTLPLKKTMTFTLSCLNANRVSTLPQSKTVIVDDINTIYKEN